MSRHSCLPEKERGDNEMIPGIVHRSLGIYLIAEECTGKPHLDDRR